MMNTATIREVCRLVEANRTALLDDIVSVVRIPSITGHEGAAQTYMARLYERLGLELDVFEADLETVARQPGYVRTPWTSEGRPNVVGTLRGVDAAGARSLALNGHIDVVSPEPLASWTYDPWGGDLVEVNGEQRLYGRGALDMKAGTIACVHALGAILEAGLRPQGTVLLQSVVEEEAGGSAGTLATLARGHTADALLNAEPFYHTIALGQPGVMLFRVRVRGLSAHAADSHLGVNAIGKMIPLYEELVALDSERAARWRDPFFDGLSARAVNLNIGAMRAGDWPSTVPGEAALECRVSFIPPQTMDEVRREVEHRIAQVAAADAWLAEHPPDVEWFGWQAGPWRQEATAPFVTTLADAAEAVIGKRPALISATAGLDARHAGTFGIPAACIGARGASMHAADEYVEVESVVESAKILATTIVLWCGAR